MSDSHAAYCRVKEIVESTGLSKAKVHALVAEGRLDAIKLDGVVLITRASLNRLLSSATPASSSRA